MSLITMMSHCVEVSQIVTLLDANAKCARTKYQIHAIVQQPVSILEAVMSANVTMGIRVMVRRAMTSTNVHFFCTIVQNIQVVSMRNLYSNVTVAKVTKNKMVCVSILTSAVA